MGRRWEELGNEITILPDDNRTARMGSAVALQVPTPEAEAHLHPNLYIQMGGAKGKIGRRPPLLTRVLAL